MRKGGVELIAMDHVVKLIDLFHICGFLSSRSRHSWVNFNSNEWESTTNIFFAFGPFHRMGAFCFQNSSNFFSFSTFFKD